MSVALVVVGLVLLWFRHAERSPDWPHSIVGGLVTGFGAFNLFDGIVDHKLLRLHQIRPGSDNLIVYDVVWIATSAVILALGVTLLRKRRATPETPRS